MKIFYRRMLTPYANFQQDEARVNFVKESADRNADLMLGRWIRGNSKEGQPVIVVRNTSVEPRNDGFGGTDYMVTFLLELGVEITPPMYYDSYSWDDCTRVESLAPPAPKRSPLRRLFDYLLFW